jgi:hypothetical protein
MKALASEREIGGWFQVRPRHSSTALRVFSLAQALIEFSGAAPAAEWSTMQDDDRGAILGLIAAIPATISTG